MNVVSLELCQELYKLSGWGDTDLFTYWREAVSQPHLIGNAGKGLHYMGCSTGFPEDELDHIIPAYDSGYLLRKLPQSVELDEERNGQLQMAFDDPDNNIDCWLFRYVNTGLYGRSNTPEDAVCKLGIELFKQRILIREAVS